MPREPDASLHQKPLLLYWLATRPSFLVASLIPVLIGVAAAAQQGHAIQWGLLLFTLLATALVHAGINVLNDYYDHANGTDNANEQRIFPFTGGSRFIQNGILSAGQSLQFGIALLLSAIVLGIVLMTESGSGLFWIGLAGVLLGWGYSAPPLQLNSRGMGELAVALGFGIVTPLGAWYVQTATLSGYPILVSLPIALLVMNILFINQFPDRAADAVSGKHHWVVRLGLEKAPVIYRVAVLTALLTLLLLLLSRLLPVWSLVSALPLIMAFKASQVLDRHAQEPQALEPAIKMTIASMVLHGILLTLTLWLA